MKVTIEFDQKTLFVDTIKNIPVIPLGYDIFLKGRIANATSVEITIEDPNTTQLLLGHSLHSNDGNESTFMFSPSVMDSTGEITRPATHEVTLKAGESIHIPVRLYKYMMDKCLVPGTMQVSISYNDIKSPPCTFMIKFTEESVDKLLAFLNDTGQDMWIRKESYLWLKKINPEFEYNFNENVIENYQFWWKKNKGSPDVKKIN